MSLIKIYISTNFYLGRGPINKLNHQNGKQRKEYHFPAVGDI